MGSALCISYHFSWHVLEELHSSPDAGDVRSFVFLISLQVQQPRLCQDPQNSIGIRTGLCEHEWTGEEVAGSAGQPA
jgi:hypothetical protein